MPSITGSPTTGYAFSVEISTVFYTETGVSEIPGVVSTSVITVCYEGLASSTCSTLETVTDIGLPSIIALTETRTSLTTLTTYVPFTTIISGNTNATGSMSQLSTPSPTYLTGPASTTTPSSTQMLESHRGLNIRAVAGGAVGGLILLILVSGLSIYLLRHNARSTRKGNRSTLRPRLPVLDPSPDVQQFPPSFSSVIAPGSINGSFLHSPGVTASTIITPATTSLGSVPVTVMQHSNMKSSTQHLAGGSSAELSALSSFYSASRTSLAGGRGQVGDTTSPSSQYLPATTESSHRPMSNFDGRMSGGDVNVEDKSAPPESTGSTRLVTTVIPSPHVPRSEGHDIPTVLLPHDEAPPAYSA